MSVEYRIQIGLSMNYTTEYLRGRSTNDRFRKNVPVTYSAGEKIKGDGHMKTVGCGKPESFLLAWVQDAT